jgi:hypothetical protein
MSLISFEGESSKCMYGGVEELSSFVLLVGILEKR